MRIFLPLLLLLFPAFASACGQGSNCLLGDRHYRIELPDNAEQGVPGAIVFAHGYRGSAAGTMRNKGLRQLAKSLGVALVAPKSADVDWLIPGVPVKPGSDGNVELAYFDALIDDLRTRHGIDTSRLMMSGFSAGGMMAWHLACYRADSFAGFAPIAGTFWAPVPDSCPSAPPNLLHIHGTSDKIVPLTGRPIGTTHQGNVLTALERFALAGNFGDTTPRLADGTLGLTCERRENSAGTLLELCTHTGGHSFKTTFLRRAWQTLVERGVL